LDGCNEYTNNLAALISSDGCLYVSVGLDEDLNDQQAGFEFYMVNNLN
tara:strand:+ start:22329 stop:22472 length:144 start_codon:yes stop_codon:yes gene_type:complete